MDPITPSRRALLTVLVTAAWPADATDVQVVEVVVVVVITADCRTSDPSRLGPRELEHHDLVSTEASDVDLVAVHTNCRDTTVQLEAYTLQEVA